MKKIICAVLCIVSPIFAMDSSRERLPDDETASSSEQEIYYYILSLEPDIMDDELQAIEDLNSCTGASTVYEDTIPTGKHKRDTVRRMIIRSDKRFKEFDRAYRGLSGVRFIYLRS